MSEGLGISNFTDYLKNDGKIFGVMVGVVIKNDPSEDDSKPGPGRVKVKIPLMGMKESNWARIASFMAGKEMGAFFLPEVGDEVLVAFENGDVNRPFVIGSLWNGKDAPPEENSDGKNNIRMIKSRSGHIIKFSDTEDEEAIEIQTKAGNTIKLDDKKDEGSISLTSAKGNAVKLDDKKDEGKIEIKSVSGHTICLDDKKGSENIKIVDKSGENKILIDSKGKKLTISSAKDIEIAAPSGKLSIKAKEIEMKSDADIKVEAGAGLQLKASAKAVLKGAMVEIN